VAADVEMVCTETTLAVSLENCRDVTLRGLAIDYDPLPFTQGRIVALAPDKAWLEFEIIEGYPENLEMRIEILDQRTEELNVETRYDWAPFQSLGNRRYRVARGAGHRYDPKKDVEEVGDILVTNSSTAPGGTAAHAIVSANCVNLVLEDIRLYASNCFSYLEHDCDGTTYRRCSIDRRPLAEDLCPRGLRRLRSSNADAFHSKHAVRGPQLIGCTAKHQGDDCVNICGEYYMVMGSCQNKIRMLVRRTSNISVGDTVELVSYTGERLPDAKVLALEADGKVSPKEQSFLQAQHMNPGTRESLSRADTEAWTLTLDRAVDLPLGSVVASARHTGNGFLVKDCDFGFNRSRGILIKGSSGQVIGNRLTGSWMAAVLVTPEWWWLESGSSSDVTIAGNLIAGCREPAIDVTARGGSGALAPSGAHRNIVIRDNTILDSPLPNIHVTSTDQLVIEGNRFRPLAPPLSRWRWGKRAPCAIVTESCDRPKVQPERIDLSAIPSAIVFRGDAMTAYRDPMVLYSEGWFRLFFTLVRTEPDRQPYSYTAWSKSGDLKNWSAPVIFTPRDQNLNYGSPGNLVRVGDEWVLCLQTYPRPHGETYGNETARIWTMRSKDLERWGEPELLRVKGMDVPQEKMGRMIDPFLLADKDEPGKWWCFYKQNGVSRSWSRDLKTWTYVGHAAAGENACVILDGADYVLFHSPANGIGVKRSRDLKSWRDQGVLALGQKAWPWAQGRLTAGFVLDLRSDPAVGKALMFFHGSDFPENDPRGGFDTFASIGLAWSDDLKTWAWPRTGTKALSDKCPMAAIVESR
jgi:hypothetical protein